MTAIKLICRKGNFNRFVHFCYVLYTSHCVSTLLFQFLNTVATLSYHFWECVFISVILRLLPRIFKINCLLLQSNHNIYSNVSHFFSIQISRWTFILKSILIQMALEANVNFLVAAAHIQQLYSNRRNDALKWTNTNHRCVESV